MIVYCICLSLIDIYSFGKSMACFQDMFHKKIRRECPDKYNEWKGRTGPFYSKMEELTHEDPNLRPEAKECLEWEIFDVFH